MLTEKDIQEYFDLRDKIIESQYMNLNDRQREAVFAPDGPLLIMAGAGSGKTATVVNKISYLLKYGSTYKSGYVPKALDLEGLELMRKAISQDTVGKTRVVTNKIAYLIEEKNVFPGNILAITFTNKAAAEMKTRVS